ncbi:MAG: gfo/Idh/MocA family oxidoreductase, partial [Chloroflexi bacterium]|nr:gfo/Idh/MocA family oxidoreductase [Chloroflexota bacterium]
MTERPLRLGVVGANPTVGWASRTHLPALLALPEYELTAVCTTKQESAEAAAQKYDAHKAYWNFRDLVNDP